MKIGLYGGTFNPPHNTHVNIAKSALGKLQLDKLIVMPCGVPPHKECYVDSATRLALTRLAFSFAEVSDYEISKSGKSFTLDTLQMLKSKYPTDELYLIIGGDSLRDFHLWHEPEEIIRLATIVVAERQGVTHESNFVEQHGGKVIYLDVEPTNISSSEIRLRYDFDFNASDFVPKEVDEYIVSHGLYQQHKALTSKLKNYLTDKRYSHTFFVTKRGLELANGKDVEKVFTACALHDCAKYIAKDKYQSYGFVQGDMPDAIVHAFLGKNVAEKDFGVTDGEVLDAIYYHTTARPNMTWLDKIVYIADKTEESRPYEFKHLLMLPTLDDIFVATLKEANEYGRDNHPDFYYLSNLALDYYTKK